MTESEVQKIVQEELMERQNKIEKVGYLLNRVQKTNVFYFNDEISIWRRLYKDYLSWLKNPEEMYIKLLTSLSILSLEFDELKFLKDYDIDSLLHIQTEEDTRNEIEYRLLDKGPFKYDGDLLITDPCYLLADDDDYDVYESMKYRSNLYGDGEFHVVSLDKKIDYGSYWADSGQVCTVYANEVRNHIPLRKLNKDSYVILKDFHGTVLFKVEEERTEDYTDYRLTLVGDGNIPFITIQTGL